MITRPSDGTYASAERIVRTLQRGGHTALLAGGCVRDLLRGAQPADYDVATSARPEEVEALFERTQAVGRQFGVILVLLDGRPYEVATFRREWGYSDGRHPDGVLFCGPEDDAARRDFTVNAMFWDPVTGELLDFHDGQADLARRLIRAVGEPEERFREDHLRLLRAVRFAARLDFAIEVATMHAIKSLAHLADRVSPERLQEELRIILTDRRPVAALRLMDELGLLTVIFPELADAKGCEQPENYHPEGDVFVHTLLTVEKLPPCPDFELAMAALLHDVGKPAASRKGGPKCFPEHCRIGAEMSRAICRRLRLSNAETDHICWLVERHLYFKDARKMRDSTLKRLFAHPGFERLAELHRADALASWGNLEDYEYVMERRRTMPVEQVAPPPLISGHDLIAMGYRPGPLFAEVLAKVRDAQLDGEVSTSEDARELAHRLAAQLGAGKEASG